MTEPAPAPRRRRPTHRTGQLIIATIECYALAEMVWYFTHGDQHLHEAIGERLERLRGQLAYRAQVVDTLRMIRRLPER